MTPRRDSANVSWRTLQDFETRGDCNCHAPGINGEGGRDLMEAEGVAYESGVHCDVCHRVESLDPEGAPAGGALKILAHQTNHLVNSLGNGSLPFGPNGDNVNANMGSVERPFSTSRSPRRFEYLQSGEKTPTSSPA